MRRVAIGIVVSIAGIGLLVWQVRRAGPEAIAGGLAQVGWGFLAILALSFARFALRSFAWTTLMDGRASLGAAVSATLAGDAIGNLTPLSLLVSEPVKALYLRDRIPGSRSFAALTAENFFYSISVAIFIVIGTAAMLVAFAVPEELRWAGLLAVAGMVIILVAALWLAWRKPALASATLTRLRLPLGLTFLERVRRFETTTYDLLRQHPKPLVIVLGCEAAFHILSFAEAYYTVWLITGRSAPVAALVFDTFNRIVNIVFRAMPLRIGVDEASTAIVAPAIGFSPAVGVTIALARKGRMLVWAAAGIALAVRKGLTAGQVMDPGEGREAP